jgi:hypothetical protein
VNGKAADVQRGSISWKDGAVMSFVELAPQPEWVFKGKLSREYIF